MTDATFARAPECPPCNQRCNQGRDCPANEPDSPLRPPMTARDGWAAVALVAASWVVVGLLARWFA